MKVLLIDVNYTDGSTGQIVYNLYQGIRAHGDEAAVCYGRGPSVKEKNVYKFGLDAETYLHAALTRLTGWTGCFSFFSTRRLMGYIKKFQPDVVHIHELHAYFVNIAPLLKFLRKRKIKTIFSMHCDFLYTGKCGISESCNQWEKGCEKCPNVQTYPKSLFFDRTKAMYKKKKRLFDGWDDIVIVSLSEWMKDRVKRSFFNGKRTVLINNGIDIKAFQPKQSNALRASLGIDEREKVVLALAPDLMSEAKGGKHVLQLAKLLQDDNVRFVMVGIDGEVQNEEKNIVKKGRIYDKNVLAEYYSMADAFVICSSQETFPTTCLEAQCCGTPIYGFDVGGTKETALDESKDNFVAYGDVQALAQKLREAPKKTVQQSEQISKQAQEKFSCERMVQKHYEIYEN